MLFGCRCRLKKSLPFSSFPLLLNFRVWHWHQPSNFPSAPFITGNEANRKSIWPNGFFFQMQFSRTPPPPAAAPNPNFSYPPIFISPNISSSSSSFPRTFNGNGNAAGSQTRHAISGGKHFCNLYFQTLRPSIPPSFPFPFTFIGL
jgi:hypothetical protein